MFRPFPDSSALVAQLVSTLAGDMVAAFIFFYDKVAMGALDVVQIFL